MQPPTGDGRARRTSPQGGKPPQRPADHVPPAPHTPAGEQVVARRPRDGRYGYSQGRTASSLPLQKPRPRWFTGRVRIRKGHVALALVVLSVFGVFLAVGNARVRALELELLASKDVVREALDEVEARERQLRFTQTEEYIEREARERYGFMKADEIRFLPDGTVVHPEPIILPRDRVTPPPELPEGEEEGAEGEAGADATDAPDG